MKTAISDKLAKIIVLHRFMTVDQCVQYLSEVEAHQESRQKEARGRINRMAGCQAEASTGSHQSAKANSGSGNQTTIGNRSTAPITNASLERMLNLVYQGMQELQGYAGGGSTPQTRAKRPAEMSSPERKPSEEYPCRLCKAIDHRANKCPDRRKSQDDKGLDSRSGAQSKQ